MAVKPNYWIAHPYSLISLFLSLALAFSFMIYAYQCIWMRTLDSIIHIVWCAKRLLPVLDQSESLLFFIAIHWVAYCFRIEWDRKISCWWIAYSIQQTNCNDCISHISDSALILRVCMCAALIIEIGMSCSSAQCTLRSNNITSVRIFVVYY